jgi:uncharacterized NAD-dependent epimerase/dehydratase family protein
VKRYLILAEGYSHDPNWGKTAHGVVRYAPDPVAAILDSTHAGESYEGIPVVATVAEALEHGPTTAIVGVALTGGPLPESWRSTVRDAIEAGLDVEAGTHAYLADDEEFAALAAARGVELRDLRRPPDDLTVSTGAAYHSDAKVVLAVGSDCAIGKKTVMVELDREARARGLRSVFVPTGQTGVAIAGWGIAVDAVKADFLAGAAERLVLEGSARGDLIFVEGQGSLLHPQFSGVTLGLFHGVAPHALVLCHLAGSDRILDLPEHPIPPLAELVELHERIALPLRPARVCAVALNTSAIADDGDARRALLAAEDETGLPADDPVRFGPARLLDAVVEHLTHLRAPA